MKQATDRRCLCSLSVMKVSFGRPLSRLTKIQIALLLLGMWASALFLGPLVATFLFICTIALSIQSRNVVPAIVVFGGMFMPGLVFGIAERFSARPSYMGHGLPSAGAFNLDRDTRMWPGVGGCIVNGGEWMTEAPHNFGLKAACTLLGPPASTYKGVYPSEQEARTMTEKVPPTPVDQFAKGVVYAEGKRIELGSKYCQAILQDLGHFFWDENGPIEGSSKVVGCVTNGECLVVRIVADLPRAYLDESHRDAAMLIDTKTMKPFARYAYAGSLPRIPKYAFAFSANEWYTTKKEY